MKIITTEQANTVVRSNDHFVFTCNVCNMSYFVNYDIVMKNEDNGIKCEVDIPTEMCPICGCNTIVPPEYITYPLYCKLFKVED